MTAKLTFTILVEADNDADWQGAKQYFADHLAPGFKWTILDHARRGTAKIVVDRVLTKDAVVVPP